MASLNKVQIIGHLGRDPELRHTANRTAVATLSVATSHQDTTEWHRIVVWDKLAELCALHLAKGRSVFVEGRLHTNTWEDAQKQKRTSVEIIAHNVQFLGRPLGENVERRSPTPAPSIATSEALTATVVQHPLGAVRLAESCTEVPF